MFVLSLHDNESQSQWENMPSRQKIFRELGSALQHFTLEMLCGRGIGIFAGQGGVEAACGRRERNVRKMEEKAYI
jgi:hypothetical protein